MVGNQAGGFKARDKILAKDPLYYKKFSSKGGKASFRGGFAANPELASIAGQKGGKISKRRPKVRSAYQK